IYKISRNIKQQILILKNHNIILNNIFDINLESYVLNNLSGKFDLLKLSKIWLKKYDISCFENIFNKFKCQNNFNKIPVDIAASYLCNNVNIILILHIIMWNELQKDLQSKKVFQTIEIPMIGVLSSIERNGVLVDQQLLSKQSKLIHNNLIELKLQAHKILGDSFNLSSPKQIRTILCKIKEIDLNIKTPKGELSTNCEVLSKFASKYPLLKIILKYRSLLKLKSSYIDKLLMMVNSTSGRIHTSYQQSLTVTGRLSSTSPNLQNIPVNESQGFFIRQAFIAGKFNKIVSADYSQIELRIIASLSQDKNLLEAFNKDEDIHCATAAEFFRLPIKKINNQQRRIAKKINFSVIYGISSFGLANQLNINIKKAKEYIDIFFKRYPNVLTYIKNTYQSLVDKGYITTLEGRKLYLANIKTGNCIHSKSIERNAINAQIQGTAAEIIKKSMVNIDNWLEGKDRNTIKMIIQIHDELLFEIHEHYITMYSKKIKFLMEHSIQLKSPLLVKIRTGLNWNDMYNQII
ncbi:MAG: DNA polymerase I, partial [Pantoea sp. Edef]|nr:DNA polymerase I [Pantoea sp. Edef]